MLTLMQQHPYVVFAVLAFLALSGLTSVIPPKWRNIPVVGIFIRFLGIVSALTHSMASGTLKLPGVPDKVLNAAKLAVEIEEAAKRGE